MTDEVRTMYELARSAVLARFRVLRVEGEEHPDRSWQRITCHVHREDLPWAAVPLMQALAALSFGDARPRGVSGVEYRENDEWTHADFLQRAALRAGAARPGSRLRARTHDKTTVTIDPQGRLVVQTRNRHEMALRWLGSLKGKTHVRLVGPSDGPGEAGQ